MKKFISMLLSLVTVFGCLGFTGCDMPKNININIDSSDTSGSSDISESSDAQDTQNSGDITDVDKTGESTSWDSPIAQNGIGMTVNAMRDAYIQTTTGEVFDEQKLHELPLKQKALAKQETVITEGLSVKNYYDSLAKTFNSKFTTSNSASAEFPGIFSASVSSSFSSCFNSEVKESRSTSTSEYYYNYSQTYNGYELWISGNTNLKTFENILSDVFLEEASEVTTVEKAKEFFTTYGTHVITGGIFGGKINVTYEIVTNNEEKTSKKEQEIKAEINRSIGASINYEGVEAGGQTSSGIGTELTRKAVTIYENEAIFKNLTVEAVGGMGFMTVHNWENLDNCGGSIERWAQTVPDNMVLIDAMAGSLISLWDILPSEEKYNDARGNLMKAFKEGCQAEWAKLLDAVSVSDIPTYIIKQENHMVKHDSDYKLSTESSVVGNRNFNEGFELGSIHLYGCEKEENSYVIKNKNDFAIRYKLLENPGDLPNSQPWGDRTIKWTTILGNDEQKKVSDTPIGNGADAKRIGYGAYFIRVTYSNGDTERSSKKEVNFLDGKYKGDTVVLLAGKDLEDCEDIVKIEIIIVYELKGIHSWRNVFGGTMADTYFSDHRNECTISFIPA